MVYAVEGRRQIQQTDQRHASLINGRSNVQGLIGDVIMIRRTSAIEDPRKDDNEVDAESNANGAGLPAVDVLTSSTLRAKNDANWSAV